MIFTQGIDLPGFASFPLLETTQGRALLRGYYQQLMALGQANGVGVILEAATWVANRDRAAPLGYGPDQLRAINGQAIALLSDLRRDARRDLLGAGSDQPILISANIGPRADAYGAQPRVSASEAATYHADQMAALAQTSVDLVTAYTLADPREAIGITSAAAAHDLPIVVAFTVEQDGHLPDGTALGQAIAQVDQATQGYASYFMVNCAHPDHFEHALDHPVCAIRLRGMVANASRCSHAELDMAKELDAGHPQELGQKMGQLRAAHPQINVLGGCCGTDMRHLEMMAKYASA